MIVPVLVDVMPFVKEEYVKKDETIPRTIGKHDSAKPYSDAELEPT